MFVKNIDRSQLIHYIMKHSAVDGDILDSLSFELDEYIYYYGGQFRSPKERSFLFKRWVKNVLNNILSECGFMFQTLSKNRITTRENNIISNSYFSVNDELRKIGYNVYTPFWRTGKFVDISAGRDISRALNGIRNSFESSDFIEIINESFFNKIKKFREQLKEFYLSHHIAALIVPYDMPFLENLSINIFKEIKKPSFVFLHGLPMRYNNIDENRSDYLIVWGKKIKEAYIDAGIKGHKIFISGHPYYKNSPSKELAFDLKEILIITKSTGGGQRSDRGNMILYLYMIQNVLKKLNVNSVRVRVHPSENPQWYWKFLDSSFFKMDQQPLADSLKRSSLVIGSSSTVLLESMYYGVNYAIYEPSVDDIDLVNLKLAVPFNGHDPRIPVAKNEDELMKLLKDRKKIDASCFSDYIKMPFDITFINPLIKDH